jgi:hypothetical protein
MEPKFQTSFIPRKPVAGASTAVPVLRQPDRSGTSIFMMIAVALFVVSLVGIGGAYIWKAHLFSVQGKYKEILAKKEQQFNIDRIEQLKQFNVQIDTAKQLLKNHLAVSQIFGIISQFTIENVRFLSLDLTSPVGGVGDFKVAMSGSGANLSAVAFQSDVLGALEQYGLRRVVKNPIISDPGLDQGGVVSFGFSATIDPASLLYEKTLMGQATTTGSN